MPIVNCFISSELLDKSDFSVQSVVLGWANEANVAGAADEMTINIMKKHAQGGRSYPVMAWLYLPSLWAADEVDRLQTGLAKSLAGNLQVLISEVMVITSIVETGRVVEHGKKVSW